MNERLKKSLRWTGWRGGMAYIIFIGRLKTESGWEDIGWYTIVEKPAEKTGRELLMAAKVMRDEIQKMIDKGVWFDTNTKKKTRKIEFTEWEPIINEGLKTFPR